MPLRVATNCSEALRLLVAARIDIAFKAIITTERAGFCMPIRVPTGLLWKQSACGPTNASSSPAGLTGAGSIGLPVFWHDRIGMTAPRGAPAPVGR